MMNKYLVSFLMLCTTVSGAFAGAPVRPRILPGTAAATEAVVFWELPADYKDMKHYVVRVDGRRAGTTDHNNLRITGLRPATTYRVQVAAVDAAGREHKARTVELRTNPAPRIFDVRDYGAKGDGETLDTKAIQQAIDACTPGGEVYVPAGDYLTGALFICKSDISLHLDEGATLRAVNNLGHFPMVKNIYEGWVKDVFASVLNIGRLYGDRYRNIRVYGGGTIDNQGSLLADQQTRTENGGALNQRRSRQALLYQEEADETVETLRTRKRRKNHVATESPAVLLHGSYCGLTRNGRADRRSDTCQAHHQRYADVSQYQCCCFHNVLSFFNCYYSLVSFILRIGSKLREAISKPAFLKNSTNVRRSGCTNDEMVDMNRLMP